MLVRYGSHGSNVVKVQKELRAAGFNPGPIDGDFGAKTRAAVIKYQRKYRLDADGIVGPKTWHKLQHDGFADGASKPGKPNKPNRPSRPEPVSGPRAPGTSKIQKMLSEARSHLGYREGAGNRNKFSKALGRPPEPWCADFVSYVGRKAGFKVNTASAQGVANYLKSHGTWKGKRDPQPGDALTFRWDGSGGWADHVGIVEKVFKQNGRTYVQTIEGNSGDRVRRKVYPANSSVINGYGRMY